MLEWLEYLIELELGTEVPLYEETDSASLRFQVSFLIVFVYFQELSVLCAELL